MEQKPLYAFLSTVQQLLHIFVFVLPRILSDEFIFIVAKTKILRQLCRTTATKKNDKQKPTNSHKQLAWLILHRIAFDKKGGQPVFIILYACYLFFRSTIDCELLFYSIRSSRPVFQLLIGTATILFVSLFSAIVTVKKKKKNNPVYKQIDCYIIYCVDTIRVLFKHNIKELVLQLYYFASIV